MEDTKYVVVEMAPEARSLASHHSAVPENDSLLSQHVN